MEGWGRVGRVVARLAGVAPALAGAGVARTNEDHSVGQDELALDGQLVAPEERGSALGHQRRERVDELVQTVELDQRGHSVTL